MLNEALLKFDFSPEFLSVFGSNGRQAGGIRGENHLNWLLSLLCFKQHCIMLDYI